MTLRILIAEPDEFSQEALQALRRMASVDCRRLDQAGMRDALANYDVVWIRLALEVRERDLPPVPRCRVLVTATTGTDHVDSASLDRVGITLLSLRGRREFLEGITATAELALGLVLSLVRHVPFAFDDVRAGRWDRDSFLGRQLSGLTAGIVGYGRLGRMMGHYLLALGMEVLAFDLIAGEMQAGVKRSESLESLLAASDVVTVHVSLNETSEGLFSSRAFGAMKKGALLVNTSRGAVVDEEALLRALESGQLGGAALDTVRDEIGLDATSPLIRYAAEHRNLILTPHIGGAAADARERCEVFMAQRLVELLATLNQPRESAHED